MANKGITQQQREIIAQHDAARHPYHLAGQIIVDPAYPRRVVHWGPPGDNAWPAERGNQSAGIYVNGRMVEWAQVTGMNYAMGEVVRIPEPTNPSKSMDPPVAVPLGDLIGDLKQSGAERIKEFI
jgi:hypothetical protein